MLNYTLLDSGDRRKLEQVGEYRLVRPALNAAWRPSLPASEWACADGVFERDSSGGGQWSWGARRVPEVWITEWGGFKLQVKATGFGHLGFFPEQHENWQWLGRTVPALGANCRALNLFAYSGVASLAMAGAGAEVCHVDAARGMNDWGRRNQELNQRIPDNIRWITDDVMKFVAREQRRGSHYNGIVLDPPSFGRGPRGQVWKLEDGVVELLESCRALVDLGKPYFVLLSCHSPGFSPIVLRRLLEDTFTRQATIECGEMVVPDQAGRDLPAGIYARLWRSGK